MKIKYTNHFLARAEERNILKSFARKVFKRSDRKYYDILAKRHIAIANVLLRDKVRNIVIAYDIIGEEIKFVTIHEIKENEINKKVNSGRWIIDEEKN